MKLKHQLFFFALSLVFVNPVSANDFISREEAVVLVKDISQLLRENYVFPERREAHASELLARFEEGSLPARMSLKEFTEQTTEQLRDLSRDRHLYVEKLPAKKSLNEDWESLERAAEKEHNYGFQTVEVLAGNVGYLKISEFMHPQRGFATASAAMTYLAANECSHY